MLDYPNAAVMYLVNWSESAGMLRSNSVAVVDLLELEHYMSRQYDHDSNPIQENKITLVKLFKMFIVYILNYILSYQHTKDLTFFLFFRFTVFISVMASLPSSFNVLVYK